MDVLDEVDWAEVRRHYDARVIVHQRLVELADTKVLRPFFRLALGIDDAAGNYSAAEHNLGPKIAAENPNHEQRVLDLATAFRALSSGRTVPSIVRSAQLRYLGVGVGSELSCMVNPSVCWVANTRTIWTHLVFKHRGSIAIADEELALYRDGDTSSEMAYLKWAAIHRDLERSLAAIAEQGSAHAATAGVEPGSIKYLWADAVANYLYDFHH